MDTWLEQTYIIMKGKKPANHKKKQKLFVEFARKLNVLQLSLTKVLGLLVARLQAKLSKFKKIALGEPESKEIVKDYVKKQRHYISEIEKALDRN